MLEKRLVDSLYPVGWAANPSGDLEKFNEATAANLELITEEMANLAYFRDPEKTVIISDLEREYGINNDNLTESERRELLAIEKYKMESDGSVDTITAAIQNAGFTNLTCYENSPAVDPGSVVGTFNFMVCGGNNSYCGYEPVTGEYDPVCGIDTVDGYVLANGPLYNIERDVLSVCGGTFAGDTDYNNAGYFLTTSQAEIEYPITDDPNRWAHFLFVGGAVTRDSGTGSILSIGAVDISEDDRNRLERIILKFKPIEKWVIMVVNYI